MHTKEPWTISDSDESWQVIGGDGSPVFSRTRVLKDRRPTNESVANRERILACVNALTGIEDPSAFVAAVDELLRRGESGNWTPLFQGSMDKLRDLRTPKGG